MEINIKCFATLSSFQPKNSENFFIEEDIDIIDLIEKLGLNAEDIKIVFINGRIVKLNKNTKLKNGDRVGFFPAVGGG